MTSSELLTVTRRPGSFDRPWEYAQCHKLKSHLAYLRFGMLQVKSGGNAQSVAQSTAQAIGTAVATALASASTKVTTTGL